MRGSRTVAPSRTAVSRATPFVGFLVLLAVVVAGGTAATALTFAGDRLAPSPAGVASTEAGVVASTERGVVTRISTEPPTTESPLTPAVQPDAVPPTTSTSIASFRYQETSGAISYSGTWGRATHSGFSGGAVRWAKTRGASATFRFTGLSVTWYGPKGPTRGKAKIYLNGVYRKTIDLYASSFAASRALYTATYSSDAARTLKIIVLGTAGRPVVAIDDFVVRRTVTTTTTPPPPPPPTGTTTTGYPADTTLKYLSTPSLPRPAYLAPLVDPVLGTRTIRISNTSGVRHAYSRLSAWNSDGSKILLPFTSPGRMLDGSTYRDLGAFNQVADAIWSNVDPNKLFGVVGNAFYRQDATTAAITKLRTFTSYAKISIGDYEGGISDDDRYIALFGTTSTGSRHLITYNVAANSVVGDIPISGANNVQISRKGNYVVVVNNTDGTAKGQGVERYTRDLTSRINLNPYGRHGDNALDAAGNEIYVANATGAGVRSYRLSDGAAKVLIPEGSAFGYGHTSGRNIHRPGWVYLSVYDNTVTAGQPGHDQVVAVKTDGSGTVEVFAFTHHTNTTVYSMQPHAVPSPDGKRVVFASEWGTSGVTAFVAGR